MYKCLFLFKGKNKLKKEVPFSSGLQHLPSTDAQKVIYFHKTISSRLQLFSKYSLSNSRPPVKKTIPPRRNPPTLRKLTQKINFIIKLIPDKEEIKIT
jgi:hypothetical protein